MKYTLKISCLSFLLAANAIAQTFDSTGGARLWAHNGSTPDTGLVYIDNVGTVAIGSIIKSYSKSTYGCGYNGWDVTGFCIADPNGQFGNAAKYENSGNYFYEAAMPANYCPAKSSKFYTMAVWKGDTCPGGGG